MLLDKGKSVIRLHYKDCMRGVGYTMQLKLRKGEVESLWIVNQRRPRNDVPTSQIKKFVSVVGQWIKQAKSSGIPVYVLGITGDHWNHVQWDQMIFDGTLCDSKHRFCAMNLKLDVNDERPSNVCLRILSTTRIEPTPCRCNLPFKEHMSDWNHVGESHTHRLRNTIFPKACCILLERGAFSKAFHAAPLGLNHPDQRSTPDSRDTTRNPKNTTTLETTGTVAFPTDERVEWKKRRKENKEKGIEVKRRKKIVEEHYDDCGTDLSGLGPLDVHLTTDINDDTDPEDEVLVAGLSVGWFKGSEWENHEHTTYAPNIIEMCDVYHMLHYLDDLGEGTDVCELCGGEGRVSTLAIIRSLNTGENFDLVTNWDLNDPSQQRAVKQYVHEQRPLVIIMGPTCKPFGKLANYNYWHHYDAWKRSYDLAAPHGRFCGEIAMLQHNNGRYYVVEQPDGSWLFEEYPWPAVLQLPGTTKVVFDQCRVGLRTKEGLLAKKPTMFIANHEILLSCFQNLRCTGNHEHGQLVGGRAAAAQVWTWDLAQRIVEGIVRLKQFIRNRSQDYAYPTVGTGPDDEATQVPERYQWKCKQCRNNISKYDVRHTRIESECRHHDVEPITYDCPGCKEHKPASHKMHNYNPNQCKWAVAHRRRSHMRTGRHPRMPRTPAIDDETKDAQAQLPDGTDLGQGRRS